MGPDEVPPSDSLLTVPQADRSCWPAKGPASALVGLSQLVFCVGALQCALLLQQPGCAYSLIMFRYRCTCTTRCTVLLMLCHYQTSTHSCVSALQ